MHRFALSLAGMECGIVGFPGVGKTRLFQALTAHAVKVRPGAREAVLGQADIPDPRLAEIARCVPTREIVPARLDLVDIPGIPPGGGAGHAQVLGRLRQADALCHTVDDFSGRAAPADAFAELNLELVLADLVLVDGARERAAKAARGGDDDAAARRDALDKARRLLDEGNAVSAAEWSAGERAALSGYGLLSAKPQLVVANVREAAIGRAGADLAPLSERVAQAGGALVALCAELESEIAELAGEERTEILRSMGLDEPAIAPLARALGRLLGLTTFYTANEKMVRAWIVRRGATALDAAGAIHSDLARGFIRAECYHVDELARLGSEKALREAGRLRVEGRGYVVRDGDVVHVLFNL